MSKYYYDEFKVFEEAWSKFWVKHRVTNDPYEAMIVLKVKRRISEIHDLIKMLYEHKYGGMDT